MKTTFRTRQPYADIFLKCAEEFICNSLVKPEHFISCMENNQGAVAGITGKGLDEEGLERKNPVIVALGDSVTAGHFESLLPTDQKVIEKLAQKMMDAGDKGISKDDIEEFEFHDIEITDARESYVEKFRNLLIDKYERTSVSVINAGIAGDTLVSMSKRAYRDVIRYQPDLILLNGSLNWSPELGSTEDYKKILVELVRRLKKETSADIVLLTPNGEVKNQSRFMECMGIKVPEITTPERVTAIREVAREEQVCLADVYAVWKAAKEHGCPWSELLANGSNHPGVEGHEVYAKVLMKLFE